MTAQPVTTPTQSSPGPKATPKSTLKALPTVRDHTSDQLGPGGDEYVAREYDEQGEQKVNDMGYLQGGRDYKIRTFTLPGRGDKLFMLATECARTLQYRDSYLLFNKNRSLFKIIASPKDKEELVAHDILPYSYRSRQIALVTARSMFRQFGSRVIKDGRRVRDDYWEAKARKQGFTEDDAAGEKRPGAARAREAAAAEALGHRQLQLYGNIVYANDPNFVNLQPPPLPPGVAATMPQIPLMEAYDAKYRDVQRPRIENVGPAYTDITRTSSDAEIANQASHAADYSKQINVQGRFRKGIVEDYWHRPHEPPVSTPQPAPAEPVNATQALRSPSYDNPDDQRQSSISLQPQQTTQTPMNPPSYPHQQNPMQSPQPQHNFTPTRSHVPRQSSGLSTVTTHQNMSAYGYSPMNQQQQQQQQQWGGPPPQPQPSPAMQNRMYNQTQSSPHMSQNQMPSPMNSQSPHPQQPQMQPPPFTPQMISAGMSGSGQLVGPGAGLRAMNAGGYNHMAGMPQAQMYNQMANQNFMQQQQQQQHGAQPQQSMYGGQQWQQNYQ